MYKKEIIAMILAGGQGSRLKLLTKNVAKPAVPFGGKYKIIDFTLSNCSNSGIDTVGVLTQYKPQALNSYIGIGSSWDLDRNHGGVSMLPPYMEETGGCWYTGTANSIYQNFNYIECYDPEYVLILSGDHIYKMNYNDMLTYHKEKNADATIAVINVPYEEANRFGIMNTTEDNKIYEFDEKPMKPKSTLASMGIYIFNWKVLKKFLIEDEKDKTSANDFGKNIIPNMIKNGQNLYAYSFNGYWKDVGTIESLWEANMDLLQENNKLNIFDSSWKIYSQVPTKPSQYIGPNAKVENSLIVEGCIILGEVINSVLFPGVYVGENTKIINSVIMTDSRVEKNVIVDKAIIGSDVVIKRNCVIGNSKDIALIADGKTIDSNFIIE